MTKLVVKNISAFQQCAFGGTFRQDGRLLVAGDEEARVRLFDTSTKTVLRYFKGHKAPVHRAYFTSDMVQVASFSDDKTVKVWDIATEQSLNSFEEHTDYVRAGCVNPVSSTTILSGGYDNLVKMYDTRSNECVFTANHGSPVESLVFFPTGGIFCSAGGTEIKVWDAIAGGKLIANISQHSKTVTCMKLTSNGKHLISGSLDRHVKFYDTTTYKTIHNIDYSNAVLSLGVSKTDDTLVVGLVDGMLSVHRKELEAEPEEKKERVSKKRFVTQFDADEVIPEEQREKEGKYDKWLRKFEYSKALDAVMVRYVTSKNPEITISLIQQLIHRKGLEQAFADRSQNSLARIITFFNKYLSDYRFTKIAIDAVNILLGVYENSFDQLSPDIQKLFIELAARTKKEEQLTVLLLSLQGSLELLLAGAGAADPIEEENDRIDHMQATESAKQTNVIRVS